MRRKLVFVFPAMIVAFAIGTWCGFRSGPTPTVSAAQKVEVAPKSVAPAKDEYAEKVLPIFAKYCNTCHNDQKRSAGLTLEPYKTAATAKKAKDIWETVKEQIENKQMPPKGKPQPSDEERKIVAAWIDSVAIKIDCGLARDPGRPTIRRLNRNEYNNTIRDLVGVQINPADAFPADDVGYGFDNIGDVLSLPPVLFEKYLTAAEKVLDAAITVSKPVTVQKDSFRPQNVRTTLGPLSKQRTRVALTDNGSAIVSVEFQTEGEYVFRARAYGDKAGTELPKLSIELDKKPVKSFEVDAVEGKPKTFEARTRVTVGRHDVAFSFTNDFYDKDKKLDRNLYIELMEIEGPFNAVAKELPESHRRIFIEKPTSPAGEPAAARKILTHFATRAYRRPVQADEVNRLMRVYQFAADQKEPFEQCVKHALKAVLVSPHFLFRIEKDREPNNPDAVHPITPHELATRLSYFLWSTMPDEELFRLAASGELSKPAVLEAQVRRMLKDPKSKAMSENFAGQWLMLRTLATTVPDKATFRSFDNALRSAMVRETELYFDHILRDDRSILEFIDSDYTFVNGRLAQHYGIPNVTGPDFRKVTLKDRSRGGILTHGSVLTLTSNPTRTSPVKRGKWVLENVLGTPPPPPAPDAPPLPEDAASISTGSVRQRLEKHRASPSCATCHAKMDPLGFGLENFDAVGAYRTQDGKFPVDSSGVLPDGAQFSGPSEMRKVLLGKADLFRKNIAEKMLTFALGRGMEYYDKCAIEDVVKSLKSGNDRFSALVMAVVSSDSFQKRRGSTPMK